MALLHEDARRPEPAGYVLKSAPDRIMGTVSSGGSSSPARLPTKVDKVHHVDIPPYGALSSLGKEGFDDHVDAGS